MASKNPIFGCEVKTEPYGGFSVDIKKGKFKKTDPDKTTLFQYRPTGSKGKWARTVIIGKVPRNLQLLADTLHQKELDARARRKDEKRTIKKLGPLTTPVPNIESKRGRR